MKGLRDNVGFEATLGGKAKETGTIGGRKGKVESAHLLAQKVATGGKIFVGINLLIESLVDEPIVDALGTKGVSYLDSTPLFEAKLVAHEGTGKTCLIEEPFARQIPH